MLNSVVGNDVNLALEALDESIENLNRIKLLVRTSNVNSEAQGRASEALLIARALNKNVKESNILPFRGE